MFLKHQVSQKSPKSAKKRPNMAPGSHQQPLKKNVNLLTPFLLENSPQNGLQSCPQIVKNYYCYCYYYKYYYYYCYGSYYYYYDYSYYDYYYYNYYY